MPCPHDTPVKSSLIPSEKVNSIETASGIVILCFVNCYWEKCYCLSFLLCPWQATLST